MVSKMSSQDLECQFKFHWMLQHPIKLELAFQILRTHFSIDKAFTKLVPRAKLLKARVGIKQ